MCNFPSMASFRGMPKKVSSSNLKSIDNVLHQRFTSILVLKWLSQKKKAFMYGEKHIKIHVVYMHELDLLFLWLYKQAFTGQTYSMMSWTW